MKHRDAVFTKTRVTLLPRQTCCTITLSGARVTAASSTLTLLAAIRTVVPVTWSTLAAVRPINPRLTGTHAVNGVTRLNQCRCCITITLTATSAGIKAKCPILTEVTVGSHHTRLTVALSRVRVTMCSATRRTVASSAILGSYGITVETRGADLTVRPGRVVHAALTLARQRVAVDEHHVGV